MVRHPSIPHNPLLAEPMYLAGFLERMGTGTRDLIKLCREAGLNPPEFIQEEIFRTIIWRPVTEQVTVQATVQASGQVFEEIRRLMLTLRGEMKRTEIQEMLGLKHRDNFRDSYLLPAIAYCLIEVTHPENPKHPNQSYRLSKKGKALKRSLKAKDKKS